MSGGGRRVGPIRLTAGPASVSGPAFGLQVLILSVPVLRGQMRAPGARLRPVPLPARESPNPCASSAHVQRNSLSGACTLPSRSLVLARPGLTWMHRCEALCRTSSSFTVMGQDERGHGIGGRGRVLQALTRQGAPLSPLSSVVLADPALGNVLLTGVSFAATGSWQLRVHRDLHLLATPAYR